jgi:hypothetical protein
MERMLRPLCPWRDRYSTKAKEPLEFTLGFDFTLVATVSWVTALFVARYHTWLL